MSDHDDIYDEEEDRATVERETRRKRAPSMSSSISEDVIRPSRLRRTSLQPMIIEEDTLGTCRTKRGSCKGLITKAEKKVLLMADQEMKKWNLGELRKELDVVNKQSSRFQLLHHHVCSRFSEQVDPVVEEQALTEFEEVMERTRDRIEHMEQSVTILRELTGVSKSVRLILSAGIDAHSGVQLKDYKRDYALTLASYGTLIEDDENLMDISDDIRAKLHEITRKVTEAAASEHRRTAPPPDRTTPSRPHGFDRKRELLKVELVVFKGDILTWPSFWRDFAKHIDSSDLDEDDKLAYLKKYVQSPTDVTIIHDASTGPGQYQKHVDRLKRKYDQPRKIHRLHTRELLATPGLKDDSADELLRLQASITSSVLKLQATGQYDIESFLTSLTEGLLTETSRGEWKKETATNKKVPKLDQLLEFLGTLADRQDDTPSSTQPVRERQERPERTRRKKPSEQPNGRPKTICSVNKDVKCAICNGNHYVNQCDEFRSYTVGKRQDYARRNNLCSNCLSNRHVTQACRSPFTCRVCKKKHHSLLHKDGASDESAAPPAVSQPPANNVHTVASINLETTPEREMPTTRISPSLELQAHSPWGKTIRVMACYDTAADVTVVTSQLVNKLGLQRRKSDTQLYQACGDQTTGGAKVDFVLSSPYVKDSRIRITATVVPRIGTGRDREVVRGEWPFLDELQLADPEFRKSKKFDLLLGSNLLTEIAMDAPTKRGESSSPMADKTRWGWIVQGDVPSMSGQNERQIYNLTATQKLLQTQTDLYGCLKEFCNQEEVPEAKLQNLEDEEALAHYRQTHQILPNGRFEVSLPWKTTTDELGSSREQAVKRFLAVERNLTRKNKLGAFHEVIKEYLSLGHAEKVPAMDLSKAVMHSYYLPMHTVFKTSSTTTKLRVVFDASASTSNGIALNELLLIGPNVYPLITDILLRFRQHDMVLTADIAKMFRGISLSPGDRDYHRFIWRERQEDPLVEYRMTRVTFGIASSPFLATQTLQQIAENVAETHPLAASALRRSFYVDDFLSGTEDPEGANLLRKELQEVLDYHGLQLRKWRSNSQAVLDTIPPELRETEKEDKPFGRTDSLKTLGVHWNPSQDRFHVSISELELPAIVTKRALTSDIAKTFDVLGWFSPSTIIMKMLIQELWEEKTNWDEQVSTSIQETWTEWRKELPELAARPIKRPYFATTRQPVTVELHGFSDASLRAYAAVIYIRATYDGQSPTITLVTAKTRVAPVKGSTIPRLELCGAQLLASLMTSTRQALDVPLNKVFCWLDSTIVLHWLDGHSRDHKTYVRNRVRRSLESLPPDRWKHVPGIENPADCASRGVFPCTLVKHPLWWHGPPWLQIEPILTPPQPTDQTQADSEMTQKETKTVSLVTTAGIPWLVGRYGSHYRLKRCVAWIMRFVATARKRRERGPYRRLTTDDVIKAETLLCRQAQQRCFPEPWKQDKKLRSLNPSKDQAGLIRVNGRLGNSELHYAQRFPIILRGNDPLTRLLVRQQHLVTGHAGPTLLLSSLGRRYFLIQGMAVVKALCRNCVTCTKVRAKTEQQLMGQLPTYRVTPGAPFQTVGTDFAGPMTTKRGYTRKPAYEKSYVCAFVCLTTKAVHLEAVSSLTTADFMACLTRFVARRGMPLHIHSDNGSNFVGASRELEEAYAFMRKADVRDTIDRFCTNQTITWHFNPARAPHFGGIWEAVVKSFKFHLRRITMNITLNMEELATVLTRIEAALNSRPLVPVHAHSEEGLDILTPGHFLIGRPLVSLPDTTSEEPRLSLSKRWKLCQQLNQQFWKGWSSDYLRQLHSRTKWQTERRNVQVGDIVVIREEQTFQTNRWPLARVSKVHTGRDGLVRAVDLWTGNKTCCRPIAKITVLVQAQEPENGTLDIPLSPGGMSGLADQAGREKELMEEPRPD